MWALVAAAVLFVVVRLFMRLTAKPASKNPFETDARKPRKEYVIDQKERDSVIKQNYNLDKVRRGKGEYPIP